MPVSITTGEPCELDRHMKLLDINPDAQTRRSEIETAPIFTPAVRDRAQTLFGSAANTFTQYGFIGGVIESKKTNADEQSQRHGAQNDPRLFYNVAAPSSVFICGSQGSGKSHTLSCLLESCLLPSPLVNNLPRPLTGIIFHYDTFSSDAGGGLPCEAASLSSNRNVSVRVLCSPTNIRHIQGIYREFPNVSVQELRISQDQLNTQRMMDLMALSASNAEKWPLYMSTVSKVLRDMRLRQQSSGENGFNYQEFKKKLAAENLTPSQLVPLEQRLSALESFMVASHTKSSSKKKKGEASSSKPPATPAPSNLWVPKAGQLTIVDLSCPCVSVATACSLFNICLALFLENRADIGRVVALDEAHKYMTGSAESEKLTESLLSAIRLQRHLAARIFISTQEPTISPALLDLCTATIVHRFTSPAWLNMLSKHLAGVSSLPKPPWSSIGRIVDPEHHEPEAQVTGPGALLEEIVDLRRGEAFLFAPTAAMRMRVPRESYTDDSSRDSSDSSETSDEASSQPGLRGLADSDNRDPDELVRLRHHALRIQIRDRVTKDGGRSKMAS